MRNGNRSLKAKFFLGELVPEKAREEFSRREKEMTSSSDKREKEAMQRALLRALNSSSPEVVLGETWGETVSSFMEEAREHVSFMGDVKNQLAKKAAGVPSEEEKEALSLLNRVKADHPKEAELLTLCFEAEERNEGPHPLTDTLIEGLGLSDPEWKLWNKFWDSFALELRLGWPVEGRFHVKEEKRL